MDERLQAHAVHPDGRLRNDGWHKAAPQTHKQKGCLVCDAGKKDFITQVFKESTNTHLQHFFEDNGGQWDNLVSLPTEIEYKILLLVLHYLIKRLYWSTCKVLASRKWNKAGISLKKNFQFFNFISQWGWHGGAVVSAVAKKAKQVVGLIPGPLCVGFACCPCVCLGSLLVLWLPPTVQKCMWGK